MPEPLIRTAPRRRQSSGSAAARTERTAALSPAQQAALLPERLRGVAAANLHLAVEVDHDVVESTVDAAAKSVLDAHEVLRTVYPADRRTPYQKVIETPETLVTVNTISDDTELAAALEQDVREPFDTTAEIPLRLRLHRGPHRTVLSLVAHPVAADDRTMDLLARALISGGEAAPSDTAVRYRDVAAAQLKTLTRTGSDDASLQYWTERLAELPRSQPTAEGTGPRRSLELNERTVAALESEHRDIGWLAALLASALRDAGAGADVVLGLVDPPGDSAADVFGSLANHLVLRLDSSVDAAPATLLDTARDVVTQAREHGDTRIERLTHQLHGAEAVSRGSLFPALLSVRAAAHREVARRIARPYGVELVVDAVREGDGVTLTIDFPARLAESDDLIDSFVAGLARRAEAWAQAAGTVDEPIDAQLFDSTPDDPYAMAMTGLGGPPATDNERIVAATIRSVLDLDEDDDVGREDTFFSLGGDSIAALRMVTLLAEQQHFVAVHTVFGFPAVHEIAERLSDDPAVVMEQTQGPAEVAPMSASGLDAAALQALGQRLSAT